LSYGKRSILIDHEQTDGVPGLVSLIGVRYTMARGDAARAIDLVSRRLGRPARARGERPVFGGDLEAGFEAAVAALQRDPRVPLDEPTARALAHNHGSAAGEVLALAAAAPELARPLAGSPVLAAEVVHAVRREMALSLGDVAFRRTDLATTGAPPLEALYEAATLMARELGWTRSRILAETGRVRERLAGPRRQAA
ncbi:MAG: glycerol-3-phosphate dehydrogenase C-terminal domain-containing protein, partial [Geminicoccaceae bacterium]|nr:glycerol-3-phosphate dehydrogenase C-terminal domain-containing protein [Geminicoccaceae bacterium]